LVALIDDHDPMTNHTAQEWMKMSEAQKRATAGFLNDRPQFALTFAQITVAKCTLHSGQEQLHASRGFPRHGHAVEQFDHCSL
jgi:alkylhydroperoxidase family enzyme